MTPKAVTREQKNNNKNHFPFLFATPRERKHRGCTEDRNSFKISSGTLSFGPFGKPSRIQMRAGYPQLKNLLNYIVSREALMYPYEGSFFSTQIFSSFCLHHSMEKKLVT